MLVRVQIKMPLSSHTMAMAEQLPLPHSTGYGFDPDTGIYHSLLHLTDHLPDNPTLHTAAYVLSHSPHPTRLALIDSTTAHRITYAQFRRSVAALAAGLYHGLGTRKGDVVLVLSPNSVLYPIVCLAFLSIGAVITTANPANTAGEICKQVRDSGAKLAVSAPEEIHKLLETGLPTLVTSRGGDGDDDDDPHLLSIEELIEDCEPLEIPEEEKPTQSDTAAILYSSGTTGTSKGVVLTHANFIAVITLFKWSVEESRANDDVFLCFVPMFHIYGLVFFGLGLFCTGNTVVVMPRFDFQGFLDAIQTYKVSNIPAVPPVILALVKQAGAGGTHDLSSLRRVGSGAAPLSESVANAFRTKFPWVELRPGYGLTESCGAATFFASDQEAKARPASSAQLLPCFSAKVVNTETGAALPPYREGELWLKGPTVMKEYLRNEEATAAAFDSEGWLRTGDLCYIDEDGYIYVVDRIKELIKHNGYQVAPAELEAVLAGHPHVLDAAVIPIEDEEAGQIPVAYVVRTAGPGADLTEDELIQYVAKQVASYKKVRRVRFVSGIPKSAAGKILRRELILQNKHQLSSKL